MTIYKVGGCVRDEVMGLTPKDIDYVVVGSTEQEMLDQGFDKVGSGFPVFIHPKTRDEYALARTEKKTGKGYLGFETYFGPEVTLSEDLLRRDFTMNAMAEKDGQIYDPHGGRGDIEDGVVRHVNEKAFIEDPVRILRAARFAARYDFIVDPETIVLIHKIPLEEIESVPRERVVRELEKALKDGKGYQFLKNLSEMRDFMIDLFYGCNFVSNLVHIDAVYQKLGMEGALCLMAEFSASNGYAFLDLYKASTDTKALYRLIVLSGQRHVFDPNEAYELITKSDYFRRPEFLQKLKLYMKLTTLDLVQIATEMAEVKASDVDPKYTGARLGIELKKMRRKVFDDTVGL